jgi:hypothetical protein
MRDYCKILAEPKKKKKDLLAKVEGGKADETALYELAALAYQLGFESDEICALKEQSLDREVARKALLEARKPNRYKYNDTILESYIAQIVRMFSTATPLTSEQLSPVLVSEDPDALGNHCGFPDKEAHEEDSPFLFINNLHKVGDEQGKTITLFFVRRSVYFAFFGKSTNLSANFNSVHLRQSNNTSSNQTRALQGNNVMQDVIQGEIEQERLKQERLETERLEQERLERKKLEQEKLERERIERERIERERIERERIKRKRIERERIEREKLEWEKVEQEKLEREKLEREKLEREKLERERLEQEKLEQERLELRRLEESADREDLQERLAQALQAQEKLEQAKQHEQQHKKREQERQEEEKRR